MQGYRTSLCPSCSGEVLAEVSTCPSCGAVLPLEAAVLQAKRAGLEKLTPVLNSIRREPASMLAWALGIMPILVVPPTLAILVAHYSGKPSGDQRRWLFVVAVINILLSLYFWSWAGDHVMEARNSLLDWLWSTWAPQPKPGGLSV